MRVKLESWAFLPKRAHRQDAGIDLRSPIDFKVPAGGSVVIDTGIHFEIPYGYAGVLKSKSGLNVKFDITNDGLIDSGYTGSVVCKLYNHGDKDYIGARGDKITQLMVIPVMMDELEIVDEISGYERGDNGFGSTGR
jgi:dUTP pyrophosphatase